MSEYYLHNVTTWERPVSVVLYTGKKNRGEMRGEFLIRKHDWSVRPQESQENNISTSREQRSDSLTLG